MSRPNPFDEPAVRSTLLLLADAAPAPVRTDLDAARDAWGRAHRPSRPVRAAHAGWTALRTAVRRHPAVAVPVAAALVGLLVLGVLAGLPAARLSAPQPARPPSGPGALPQTLWEPPAATPAVTDRPISRAAYLIRAAGRLYVVGADRGEYRRVPADPGVLTLAPDGRQLAWATHPEWDGPPVRQYATVTVLDLPTGRIRQVDVPSRWEGSSEVESLAFDQTGRRLAVTGHDSFDGSTSFGTVSVVDLGPAGSTAALRLRPVCYRCTADAVGWLTGGRLGHDPDDEVTSGGGVTSVAVPAARIPDRGGTVVGRTLLAGPDGAVRYGVRPASGGDAMTAEPRPYTVHAWPASGPGWSVDLGRASEARGLAVVAAGVVTTRWDLDPTIGRAAGVRPRIDLATRSGVTPLTTTDDDLMVLDVATDVVDGGRLVPGVRPAVDPMIRAEQVARTVLVGAGWLLGLGAGLGAVFVALTRPWPARSARWLRRVWSAARGTPAGRRAVRATVAVLATALGLAWLAAPAAVEALAAADTPRPAADAMPIVPRIVADQTLRPPRAFDRAGVPRTARLTAAFTTTVAGRRGLYGLDAGTARLVRLDDLPGVPWAAMPSRLSIALSPSGRWLAVRSVIGAGSVVVVDLGAGRVEVRDRAGVDGRAGGAGAAAIGIDDRGDLRPAAGSRTSPAVRVAGGWELGTTDPAGVLEPWTTVRLPLATAGDDGAAEIAVATGAFDELAGEFGYEALPEPWWVWFGDRGRQPVGYLWLGFGAAVGLTLLPGRRPGMG